MKLWEGRASAALDPAAEDFNSSLRVDVRMVRQDITGSLAHAAMLRKTGILSGEDEDAIRKGLTEILGELERGTLVPDPGAEDVHTFVEAELTRRVGDAGRRLHTARSRNDQVATDVRLYLRGEAAETCAALRRCAAVIARIAKENADAVMPGYTHLQRAQPVSFGHQLLAYAWMFLRDVSRLEDASARMNECPLGACALAGTTYPVDREMTAAALGFRGPVQNSIDAVSDRDFAIELASDLSILMMHLSRLSEEMILWSSWEFRFISLDDRYTTGSSIMPQKKNPDLCELIRGKTGRIYGDLMTLLTLMKGLPLAYNKDMQEDKEAVFDAFDTVKACLGVLEPMLDTMTVRREELRRAGAEGFINATDLADYLTAKGMPFRTAYRLVGQIVAECAASGEVLETLPMDRYRSYSDLFGEDLYGCIALETCMERRTSLGGTAPESVLRQAEEILCRCGGTGERD